MKKRKTARPSLEERRAEAVAKARVRWQALNHALMEVRDSFGSDLRASPFEEVWDNLDALQRRKEASSGS